VALEKENSMFSLVFLRPTYSITREQEETMEEIPYKLYFLTTLNKEILSQ